MASVKFSKSNTLSAKPRLYEGKAQASVAKPKTILALRLMLKRH